MEAPTERSISRGRDAISSTGRGGFGNLRSTSVEISRPETGPDDFSVTRGREPVFSPDKVFSTGRGGAGNIRSPSRDAVLSSHSPIRPEPRQQDLIRAESDTPRVQSFGRGGAGNMSRSRSRDPAAALAQENVEAAAVRSRSTSRDPERRSQSKDKVTSGVSGFLQKVGLYQHREEDSQSSAPLTRGRPETK